MSFEKATQDIPSSSQIVEVYLIDTGARRKVNATQLFKPTIPGFDFLDVPSWSFLISHHDTHVLFDLSIRKDWQTGFPPVFDPLIGNAPGDADSQLNISASFDVRHILNSNHGINISPSSISACIWSHHHFDHRGDINTFPPSTDLVFGPGLQQAYLPGYPTDPEGELAESDFVGRHVRELDNDDFTLELNGLPAHDYFGDGSFYLLSTPGHTTGHLSALARTTSLGGESTFVLLGGDCAHHAGVFRPSHYLPLPRQIVLHPEASSAGTTTYDGPLIQAVHPQRSAVLPFLEVDEEPLCENETQAIQSVKKLQEFDADGDVLVCIAHDATLLTHLPTFPKTLNDWSVRGLKEKVMWEFLNDFDISDCTIRAK